MEFGASCTSLQRARTLVRRAQGPGSQGRRSADQQPRLCTQQRRQRWRRCAASLRGSDDEGDEAVDIDALASQLSAEAERLRRSGSFDGGSYDGEGERRQPGSRRGEDMLSPFGYQTKSAEAEVLAAVGDGGFSPEEFELLQELGTINIQQVATSVDLDDFPMPTSERSARTAVIAYTGTFFSGMPFQDPVVVLVKEYLPGAKAVACNELQVLKHLAGMPEVSMKWQTAASPLASYPPVVRLLGYFTAGQTAQAQELLEGEEPEDALWVVLKWEGLAPLALYPSAQQTSGIGLGRLFGGQDSSLLDRSRMLRSITRGALAALGYCHAAGVVHGALGSGSVMLSSFDDRTAKRLVVKLDNFGFAHKLSMQQDESQGSTAGALYSQQPAPLVGDETPLAVGQREDLRALAVVLLECMLSALAHNGPSPLTSTDSLQRLLGEVFVWGVDDFRRYCEDEPDWQTAVELLTFDGDAGWQLLKDMCGGSSSAEELARGRFCQL
ncbi:hypothetical protein ACK3TF_001515 [Chlorella vulgaris]